MTLAFCQPQPTISHLKGGAIQSYPRNDDDMSVMDQMDDKRACHQDIPERTAILLRAHAANEGCGGMLLGDGGFKPRMR